VFDAPHILSPAGEPTHFSRRGELQMVDVGAKPVTHRHAIARARVRMRPETARLVLEQSNSKGDVLGAARIAGIMAAKRTSELIPLCHSIALNRVVVQLHVVPDQGVINIETVVEAHDRTGVEMEAMVATSVAALTVYDMLKSVQRDLIIEQVMLVEKSGG